MNTTQLTIGSTDMVVIGGYLLAMMLVGVAFQRFTRDANDFVRSGCRATWWLVGASSFMATFSAWTFTGGAGAAFEAGWSFLVIFLCNALGFLLLALFLAPRFRQLRAISVPELIRRRFNVSTQQLVAYVGSITGAITSAIQLYGLAIFASAVFGLKVHHVIIALGSVVLFYSFLSGSWGVMATDFIQAIILFPLTVLTAFLALREIGGLGEMMRQIDVQGLGADFRIFNTDEFKNRAVDFSLLWAAAMMIQKMFEYLGMGSARRYFAVKDGREARKAALLAFVLMLGGAFLWVVPPIVAKLLFAEEVTGFQVPKPAETAYAVISLRLLPAGMTGLMVVAMFAATMSSMDTGLNANAARFINDIYPALCRLFRFRPVKGRALRWIAQAWTLLLGTAIILIAVHFSKTEGVGVFRLMQEMGAIFGSVFGVPMLLGLLIRKTPPWSAMAAILVAAIPSALGWMSGEDFVADIPLLADISWLEEKWKVHTRIFINSGVGAATFLGTMFFYRSSAKEYKDKVAEFFRCMNTPVDFEKEVGGAVDVSQLRIIGAATFVIGLSLCMILLPLQPLLLTLDDAGEFLRIPTPGGGGGLLCAFPPGVWGAFRDGPLVEPNTWGIDGNGGILVVTFTIMAIGALLYLAGTYSAARLRKVRKGEVS